MNVGFIFDKVLESGAIKSVALSVAIAGGGFLVKSAVHEYSVDNELAWHGKALTELKAGQAEQAAQSQAHTVALTKISGQLDVLNQKIDDDRNYAIRHQTGNYAPRSAPQRP